MTSATSAFLCSLILGLACPSTSAQAIPPAEESKGQGKDQAQAQGLDQDLLRITSTDAELVWSILDSLPMPFDAEIPDVEDGQQVTLRLRADSSLALTVDKAGAEILVVHARPGALKKVMKEQAGILGGILKAAVFSLVVMKLHAEPRYVARAVQAVTRFPEQIARVEIRVKRRLDFEKGLAIGCTLEPAKDTWLYRVVTGIRPKAEGAHLLRAPDASLSIAAAVEGEGLVTMLAPFAENLANLRGKSKAERKAFREFAHARLPSFDGSFSLLIDGPGRYVRLVGLEKPQVYKRKSDGAVGLAFDSRRIGRPSPTLAKAVPAALRDTGLQQMDKEIDLMEIITAEPEEQALLATFVGVVEDFSLKIRLPKDGVEAARLVERIETRRLRRHGLRESALLRAELNFGAKKLLKTPRVQELQLELGPLVDAGEMQKILEAIPEHVLIAVFKKGPSKLRFDILTR